jgi:hypothetical protein
VYAVRSRNSRRESAASSCSLTRDSLAYGAQAMLRF